MTILRMLIMTLFLSLTLHANVVSVSDNANNLSILDKSEILITSENYTVTEVRHKKFKPFHETYINLGPTTRQIWVKFTLQNPQDKPVSKLLVINNPLLVFIDLYRIRNDQIEKIIQKRTTLAPSFTLTLPPHSTTTYYLHIKSLTTLKFGLDLYEPSMYKMKDYETQLVNIFFFGIIATMIIYNLFLYFFIKGQSYLYYSLYLFMMMAIEVSYLGFSTRYLDGNYLIWDNRLILTKIDLTMIFYILYSVTFLKMTKQGNFNYVYKILLSIALLLAICIVFPFIAYQTRLEISLMMVLIIVPLIMITSIITYVRGAKEVRFYIIGFSVMLTAYFIVILDALGVVSIIYHIQSLLIIATAIEAIFLSLAFIDSYRMVQNAKLRKEHQLLEESQQRESLIQKEVAVKTDQLHHAMTMQELLFNELHHRVKNNLQLILSITRMQKKRLQSVVCKRRFQALEQRIGAIAATHNTIYLSKELEIVSMKKYLTQLIEGLRAGDTENKIAFEYDIDLNMVLKMATNIGLIVNELVSNALKHAFGNKSGTIRIRLHEGLLEISDNGKGFDPSVEKEESLGMRLVQILVKDQLKGSMNITTDTKGTKITIRFAHA